MTTVLITGASGVLGTAVRERLDGPGVIALAHRRAVEGVDSVTADLRRPHLGLAQAAWDDLADRVDVIVHCAANVDFTAGIDTVEELNVRGVVNITEFARRAEARVIHVSTAYVDREAQADITGGYATMHPSRYLASKRRGEKIVQRSGVRHVIVRPSVITGHSVTGQISEYQGFHSLTKSVLTQGIPMAIVDADARGDLVACDVVADAIAALIDHPDAEGIFWATAGSAALRAERVLELIVDTAVECGVDVSPIRRVDMDFFDRLLRPAFFADLDDRSKTKVANLLATVSSLFPVDEFPTSLGTLPDGPPAMTTADAEDLLRTSVRYVAQQQRRSPLAVR
ncbi:SDR family oxidoreductase [Gordonia mangrovi]|nr:SDR family oxidoreductase [Gordonia mangrovi]UVF77092.1 SDR family oxidoreductase [Gordonia mangrovi]